MVEYKKSRSRPTEQRLEEQVSSVKRYPQDAPQLDCCCRAAGNKILEQEMRWVMPSSEGPLCRRCPAMGRGLQLMRTFGAFRVYFKKPLQDVINDLDGVEHNES